MLLLIFYADGLLGTAKPEQSLVWNQGISAGSGIAGPIYFELNPEPQLLCFPGTGAGAMHKCITFLAASVWSQSRVWTGHHTGTYPRFCSGRGHS